MGGEYFKNIEVSAVHCGAVLAEKAIHELTDHNFVRLIPPGEEPRNVDPRYGAFSPGFAGGD